MFLEMFCCMQISILLSMSYTFMKCVLSGCYFMACKTIQFSTKASIYIKDWIEHLEDLEELEELEDIEEGQSEAQSRFALDVEESHFLNQNNFSSIIL